METANLERDGGFFMLVVYCFSGMTTNQSSYCDALGHIFRH